MLNAKIVLQDQKISLLERENKTLNKINNKHKVATKDSSENNSDETCPDAQANYTPKRMNSKKNKTARNSLKNSYTQRRWILVVKSYYSTI